MGLINIIFRVCLLTRYFGARVALFVGLGSRNVKLTTHLCWFRRVRILGSVSPLLHTCLWRRKLLGTGRALLFVLYLFSIRDLLSNTSFSPFVIFTRSRDSSVDTVTWLNAVQLRNRFPAQARNLSV